MLRGLPGVLALAGIGLLAGSVARSRVGGVEVMGHVEVEAVAAAARGMALGPEAGVPVLRVFGDYECPACAALERAAGDTLRSLARRGHIRFVYHHAPLRGHRRGPLAAAAAYCAAEADAGWDSHRALYETATDWGTGPDGQDRLIAAVSSAVGDTAGFRDCMGAEPVLSSVAGDRSSADALGLFEVPAVFFEDQRLRVRSWRALVRYVTAHAAAP